MEMESRVSFLNSMSNGKRISSCGTWRHGDRLVPWRLWRRRQWQSLCTMATADPVPSDFISPSHVWTLRKLCQYRRLQQIGRTASAMPGCRRSGEGESLKTLVERLVYNTNTDSHRFSHATSSTHKMNIYASFNDLS